MLYIRVSGLCWSFAVFFTWPRRCPCRFCGSGRPMCRQRPQYAIAASLRHQADDNSEQNIKADTGPLPASVSFTEHHATGLCRTAKHGVC